MHEGEKINSPHEELEKIIRVADPVQYLQSLFEKTSDHLYTHLDSSDEERARKQAEIVVHRKRMLDAIPALPAIGKAYAELLRSMSEALGLDPGKINVYVVGGRVQQKPFRETSDFDLVLTIEHQGQGLQATPSDDREIAARKRAQYREWKLRSLEIDKKFNMMGVAGDAQASLIEPKSLGAITDREFIDQCNQSHHREAILIYSE